MESGARHKKKAHKFKSWSMNKSKSAKTKVSKTRKSQTGGRAESDALEEALQDVDSRQSAADEHDAVGDDDGEESDGGGKDSGKKNSNPKHRDIATTRSAIASDGAAPAEVLLMRVEKRTQERDEAMKSLEILQRKIADLESAAKVHYFNICNFFAA